MSWFMFGCLVFLRCENKYEMQSKIVLDEMEEPSDKTSFSRVPSFTRRRCRRGLELHGSALFVLPRLSIYGNFDQTGRFPSQNLRILYPFTIFDIIYQFFFKCWRSRREIILSIVSKSYQNTSSKYQSAK